MIMIIFFLTPSIYSLLFLGQAINVRVISSCRVDNQSLNYHIPVFNFAFAVFSLILSFNFPINKNDLYSEHFWIFNQFQY